MSQSNTLTAQPETGTLEALKVYDSITKGDDLAGLAITVNDLHAAAQRAGEVAIDKARECGRFLIQIKQQVGHGNFTAWLDSNTSIPARTGRRYMMLARGWDLLSKSARRPRSFKEPAVSHAAKIKRDTDDNEQVVITITLNGRPHEYSSWLSAAWDAMAVLRNPKAPKSNVKACHEILQTMALKLDELRSREAVA